MLKVLEPSTDWSLHWIPEEEEQEDANDMMVSMSRPVCHLAG